MRLLVGRLYNCMTDWLILCIVSCRPLDTNSNVIMYSVLYMYYAHTYNVEHLFFSVVVLEESPCPRGPVCKSLSLFSDHKSLRLNSLTTTLLFLRSRLVYKLYTQWRHQLYARHVGTCPGLNSCKFMDTPIICLIVTVRAYLAPVRGRGS